tara:strand:- start:451 stop:819 length:369 start_codon:yes stop_codon:yes gene_type:complete
MKAHFLFVLLIALCLGCKTEPDENPDANKNSQPFNHQQWLTKEGDDYPFREKMFHTVVYNDTIRSLNKEEIINLLGPADRFEDNHYYYRIAQTRLKDWPLHTTSMVIKFSEADSVVWIKIHE